MHALMHRETYEIQITMPIYTVFRKKYKGNLANSTKIFPTRIQIGGEPFVLILGGSKALELLV